MTFTPRLAGVELSADPAHFGYLEPLDATTSSSGEQNAFLQEFGYLYLKNALDRDEVIAGREDLLRRFEEMGAIERVPGTGQVKPTGREGLGFRPDLAFKNPAIEDILYGPRMMSAFEGLFGEPVLHFDFTWLRSVGRGAGTQCHCDIVYMGRGTFNLLTAWVPFGDITREIGGLAILEKSHLHREKLRAYLSRDVDEVCTNRPGAEEKLACEAPSWNGTLANNARHLRDKLGGRWLTTDFEMGDALVFTMATVHGSLDNTTDCIRISTDSRYQRASEPADERWIGPDPVGHGPAGKKGLIC